VNNRRRDDLFTGLAAPVEYRVVGQALGNDARIREIEPPRVRTPALTL
jgi:hypothetical protein